MKHVHCIADLRERYRRRVPRMFYEYCESGALSESTLRRNAEAFERVELRQRVGVDVSSRRISASMLGQQCSMPVALAPTGLAGMQWADGEILAARAAEAFGVPFTLSAMSICSIEDVAANTSRPFWFQLYVMRDRAFVADLVRRAEAAGCSALMLTLDLNLVGQRHADIRNGLAVPPRPTQRSLLDMVTKPAWCAAMLRTRRRSFGNIVGHAEGVDDLQTLAAWSQNALDASVDWDDVARVRDLWGGKLVLKGIMDGEDAHRAAGLGADALVVSNHGGRQLDGAPATLSVLPEIAGAVGDRMEVWVDGGITSGQDVVKALASGASATLIGRSFLYGLGAMGEAGVTRCLEIIANELDQTMAFCGRTDVADIDASVLRHR